MTNRFDAIVVGARCAGAAVAMLLARGGARVLMVDRGRHGSDTVSTHALMRGAVLQLHRWGVLPAIVAAGTPPVRRATFHYGDEALTVPIKPRDGVASLYAPRRTLLDRVLVDAAVASGAQAQYGLRVVALARRGTRVTGVVVEDTRGRTETIDADLVIGADGMRSTVATLAGATAYRIGGHASGVVYGYWSDLDVDGYHWHQRPGVSAGLIPTNDGETCVFVGCSAREFTRTFRGGVEAGYRRLLAEAAPRVAQRLGAASRRRHFSAFAGQAGYFRQSWGAGWALVGDAGYFKDPITAHGITDALRDAELLGSAILQGDALDHYQAARDALSTRVFEISDGIASFEWDFDQIRALHESLARAMAEEARAMASRFEGMPAGVSA